MKRSYQKNYSDTKKEMYNISDREKKAKTMIAILKDFFSPQSLENKSVLDIGCSTGIIDNYLAKYFSEVTGIDIDDSAIKHAKSTYKKDNLTFIVGDAMNLSFQENTFDIIICSQVYEHVPDAFKMMEEIHRVLKNKGICYFAATNKLKFIEAHYALPFLSILPRQIAHKYMRIMGKGNFYHELHFSWWQLKYLVRKFKRIDYTERVINDPNKFEISYLIMPGTIKNKVAYLITKYVIWLFPGYIWILSKGRD